MARRRVCMDVWAGWLSTLLTADGKKRLQTAKEVTGEGYLFAAKRFKAQFGHRHVAINEGCSLNYFCILMGVKSGYFSWSKKSFQIVLYCNEDRHKPETFSRKTLWQYHLLDLTAHENLQKAGAEQICSICLGYHQYLFLMSISKDDLENGEYNWSLGFPRPGEGNQRN